MKLSEDQEKLLARKRQIVQRAFEGPNGTAFLELLEETFQRDLFDNDPARMAYKVAQHELVDYLKVLGRTPNE